MKTNMFFLRPTSVGSLGSRGVFFSVQRSACRFLFPQDYNDEIRQEQLRELSYLNGSDDPSRGRSVRGRGIRLTSTAATRYGSVHLYIMSAMPQTQHL